VDLCTAVRSSGSGTVPFAIGSRSPRDVSGSSMRRARTKLGGVIRRGVKAVAKRSFRATAPAVKPLAQRTRQYFADPAVTELRSQLSADQKHVEYLLARLEDGQQQRATEHNQAVAARLDDHSQLLHASIEQLSRLERHTSLLVRRVFVPSGTDALLVRTSVGYVFVDASDSAVVALLIETGDLEPGVRLLIERFLKPGDWFVDGGANVGMHTVAAARALDGSGKVLAFEPFPRTAELLQRTLVVNGLASIVDVFPLALSDRSGESDLHLGATSGHHSVHPLADDDEVIKVRTTSLDSVLNAGERLTLVKLDVEGAELAAFRGMTEVFARSPDVALIIEFGPTHVGRGGCSVEAWFEEFAQAGLDFRIIDPVTGLLGTASVAQLAAAESSNLLMARQGSTAWARLGHG
jgi:FkbM family methyltransferase